MKMLKPWLGGGRRAAPQFGVPVRWETVLLCAATALVTWSATMVGVSLSDAGEVDPASGAVTSPAPTVAVPAQPDRPPRSNRNAEGASARGARAATKPVPARGARQAPLTAQNRRATAISIPGLGIDQGVIELAVNGDSLQVPDRYSDIGWWREGPAPGEDGAAVMVGHVDSPTAPAVFYQLSGVTPGERISVELDDRSQAVFEVREAVLYDRDEFPSKEVYRTHGKPGLNLLTCGGSYDKDGGYSGNVVVYTDLVDRVPPPRKRKKSGPRADPAPRAEVVR